MKIVTDGKVKETYEKGKRKLTINDSTIELKETNYKLKTENYENN